MKEAQVVHYNENALSTIILGSTKVNTDKLTGFLNEYAARGYSIKAVEKEYRRMLLFFKRETFIIFLERLRP